MKTKLQFSLLAILLMAGGSAFAESGQNFFIWALKGPVRNNTNAYNAWRAMVVDDIYLHGFPSNALNHTFTTADVTQPAGSGNATNETLWFAFRAVSKGGDSNRVWANKYYFNGTSSDSSHYLNTHTDLATTNTVWGPGLRGVLWGAGIARSNDTILASVGDGKIADTAVDEVICAGAQLTYFTYASQQERDAEDAYLMGFPNVRITGAWMYMDGTTTNGLARKSLDNKNPQFNPILFLTANSAWATLGVNAEASGSSVVILGRPKVTGQGWSVLTTANTGDVITRPALDQYYFKLQSQ